MNDDGKYEEGMNDDVDSDDYLEEEFAIDLTGKQKFKIFVSFDFFQAYFYSKSHFGSNSERDFSFILYIFFCA